MVIKLTEMEKELVEAYQEIITEARNRGFKDGYYIKGGEEVDHLRKSFIYETESKTLYLGNDVIYKEGKWIEYIGQ